MFRVIVTILYLLMSVSSYAGYGDTCSAISTIPVLNVESKGIYDYVRYLFDPVAVPKEKDCSAANTVITACINKLDGQSCKAFDFELSNQYKFSDILSSIGSTISSPPYQDIIIKSEKMGSSICLYIDLPEGKAPFLCKKDPLAAPGSIAQEVTATASCLVSSSCFNTQISLTPFNFSGKIIECVLSSMNKLFYSEVLCEDNNNDELNDYMLNPFNSFQNNLKKTLSIALVIYVIFFGIELALGKEEFDISKLFIFMAKIVLVMYFSVGFSLKYFTGVSTTPNPSSNSSGYTNNDGLREYVLPGVLGAMFDFANYAFSAGNKNDLCLFETKDYEKNSSAQNNIIHAGKYYALADSIDCRLAYYFGLGIVMKHITGTATDAGNSLGDIEGNYASFLYFILLWKIFKGGSILLFKFCIIFAALVCMICISAISAFITIIITIFGLVYLGPVLVPMVLFERTKGYFDSWLRMLMGLAIQPVIFIGFISIMFTSADEALYSGCKFTKFDMDLTIPGINHDLVSSNYKFFKFRDVKEAEDAKNDECKNSIGYKLFRAFKGEGMKNMHVLIFSTDYWKGNFLNALDIGYLVLYMAIFYFFMMQVYEMATVIAGGPRLADFIITPKDVMNAGKGIKGKIDDYKAGKKAQQQENAAGASEAGSQRGGVGGGEASPGVKFGE